MNARESLSTFFQLITLAFDACHLFYKVRNAGAVASIFAQNSEIFPYIPAEMEARVCKIMTWFDFAGLPRPTANGNMPPKSQWGSYVALHDLLMQDAHEGGITPLTAFLSLAIARRSGQEVVAPSGLTPFVTHVSFDQARVQEDTLIPYRVIEHYATHLAVDLLTASDGKVGKRYQTYRITHAAKIQLGDGIAVVIGADRYFEDEPAIERPDALKDIPDFVCGWFPDMGIILFPTNMVRSFNDWVEEVQRRWWVHHQALLAEQFPIGAAVGIGEMNDSTNKLKPIAGTVGTVDRTERGFVFVKFVTPFTDSYGEQWLPDEEHPTISGFLYHEVNLL